MRKLTDKRFLKKKKTNKRLVSRGAELKGLEG
jgi:hypothetical protein